MRNIFSVVWLLLAVGLARPALAQTDQAVPVRLSWTRYISLPGANPEDAPRQVPSFVGATHAGREVLGTYALRLPGTVAAGELRDAVYEPFPATDVKLLGSTALPASPLLRVHYGTEARQPYSYVLLQPVRRNPQTGQAERLVAFTYTYQLDATARQGSAAARPHLITQSVLNSGDWYKVGVPASGVYKLDYATLKSLGLPVATLDPSRLQLYGNATGILPQANSAPRPDDLVQNNIYFSGNANASFEDGEYFLFYARGPHVWRTTQQPTATQSFSPGYYDLLGEGGRYKHLTNVYCDTAYYFVTVGNGAGRRIPTAAAPTATPSGAAITTFLDRRFYEHDLVNVLHSGRRWLGEAFTATSNSSRDFVFSGDGNQPLTDLVVGDTLRLTSAVGSTAAAFSTFGVALNGTSLGSQQLAGLTGGSFTPVAVNNFRTFTTLIPGSIGSDPKVTLSFTSGDPVGTGYLDYLELVVKRQLRLSGSFLEFNSLNYKRGAGTVGTFTLANAGSAQVWETTNPCRPQAQQLANGSFAAYTDSVREFVAVQPGGSFGVPRLFGRVPNQNLHALNTDGKLDLVIVTYPPFAAQAERLAQHRRDYNNMSVAVVTTKQVYNEYSSGGQDVTAIRDLMKQVYDRNPDPVNHRNYLLLFGDASYDYKSSPYNDAAQEPRWWASRTPFKTTSKFDEANQNFVPTYESRESFAPLGGAVTPEGDNSYSSEDYYGLLDDTEGDWLESSSAPGYVFETCDIGVGRLPVRTPIGSRADATQARQVVDKIIAYDTPASFGKWRNRIALTADDSDAERSNPFIIESESIFAATIKAREPAYNLQKNYLDLFPQVSVAAGQRSPAAVAAINGALEQGALLIGYTGHGGPRGLADEQIITNASLLSLRNQNRLTFLVTGTCDLSTYDNPDLTSAGEQVLTDNAVGGAVGLFTTTRVVYSTFNTEVVNNFYASTLTRSSTQVLPMLGLAASAAKNASPGGDLNNRNYTLLADPTTRLAYPTQRVVLDAINGQPVTNLITTPVTLQALSQVELSGHVENGGALNAGFVGTADITVYDKPITVLTLGDGGQSQVPVETQESIIYNGQASVSNGRFSVKFIVPKDIAYNVGLGKISLYAADPTHRVDAQGYQGALIGGASSSALTDTTPPVVQLFMTDETFVSGGITELSPLFIAHLTDNSGINTSNAGIGHEITATLDDNPINLVVVNNYYTSDLNNFMSGRVRYPYKDLAAGPHTVRLKAWDTYNNSAEGTVDFIAATTEQLALDHVLNYPNPFSNRTTFHFDQNHPGEALDVQVQIFTVAGRLVKTLRTTVAGTSHVPATPQDASLSWNGRDDYDDQLARGVYVYRVSVRLASGGDTATKFEKLVLLN